MRSRAWLLALLGALILPVAADTGEAYHRGTVGLAHQMLRLGTTARVMHIGAHPDDEDTALIAALARGQGARVAYVSLNRGEGGQNGIGPELYDTLGVLRTEELLAAREIDGGEQYFTTAYDFGFTKTADESLRRWGRERILGDLVSLIRRFRPQILISRFEGTPADGHGHHQVAGILAREAYRAAGDPKAFPEQLAAGLAIWQPRALYLDTYRLGDDGPTRLDVGDYDAVYGRSYLSLAMESRSRHRSQDMGRIEPLGPQTIRLRVLEQQPGVQPLAGIFGGLELDLAAAIPDPGEDGPDWQREAHARLVAAADALSRAEALHNLRDVPRQTVTNLAEYLTAVRDAERLVSDHAPATPEGVTWRLVTAQKVNEANEALALAAGIRIDALAEVGTVTPGQVFNLAGQAFWPPPTEVVAPRLTLEAPAGWTGEPLKTQLLLGNQTPDALQAWQVTVPADAPPSQPYWLTTPREGDVYPVDSQRLLGLPFAPPPLTVRFRGMVHDAVISLERPVQHRYADPRGGERRDPVLVRPRISAGVQPETLVVRPDAPPAPVSVVVTNAAAEPVTGQVALRLGERDLAPPQPLELPPDGRARARFELPAGAVAEPGVAQVVWLPAEGEPVPLRQVVSLDYEHIPRRLLFPPAALQLAPVNVTVPENLTVGYVPGPTDVAPDYLRQLGVQVRMLDEEALTDPAGLDGLDTILVGPRAYEVNESLQRNNQRLLDWTRRGGTLVVEYQKYPYQTGGWAPDEFTYAEPHDRVTDETAEVMFLQPDHPLLNQPNQLGPADFEGWVQERGLYFWHTWSSDYTPLLSSHDPGEPAKEGGLLVAKVGEGNYIYNAYALFRQLPAGVPGAYRMLVNLVSRGSKEPRTK